jgi:hypothetical protein
MLDRLEELLASASPSAEELNGAFWQACSGGQRRAAERLLAEGADINTSPDYAGNLTALDQVLKPDTRHDLLASWLRDQGAKPAERE